MRQKINTVSIQWPRRACSRPVGSHRVAYPYNNDQAKKLVTLALKGVRALA